MSIDLLIVIIILAVNLIISLIYLILHLRKGQMNKGWLLFAFMLVFPIVGFVFIVLAEVLNYIFHQRRTREIDLDDLSFRRRMRVITDADIEAGLNKVPIEEALIISSKAGKRKSFINLLKTDEYEDTLPAIRGAVENADLEVSHYAASFVTDVIAKYKEKEKQLRDKLNKTGKMSDYVEYIRFVSEILRPDIFSITEIKIYVNALDQAAEAVYQDDSNLLPVNSLRVLTDTWHFVGNESRVTEWINVTRAMCRENIECFKICAAYYFRVGDRDNLVALINEIKRMTSLQLDNETLELIRFYRQAG